MPMWASVPTCSPGASSATAQLRWRRSRSCRRSWRMRLRLPSHRGFLCRRPACARCAKQSRRSAVADIFTKAKRSDVMSRIRARGNEATELALIRIFRAHDITGWRRQISLVLRSSRREEAHAEIPPTASRTRKSVRASSPRLPRVRADFVFPKLRLAVFVDGCFWHGCPRHETKPRNNAAFWRRKFAANKTRDRLVTRTLRGQGWRVLRIWEHELARKHEARMLRRIHRALA